MRILDKLDEWEANSHWTFEIQFETEFGSVNISTVQWFNQDGIHSKNNHLHAEDYLEKMWMANGSPYYELFVKGDKDD